MPRLVRQRPMDDGGNLQANRSTPADSAGDYAERLAKYIPAEILGAYVVFNNAVESMKSPVSLIIVIYALLFVLNTGYLWMTAGEVRKKEAQILVCNLAFLVWSYAIGGAVWSELQTALGVNLRHPLSVTMLPVLVSLALGKFSPDGLSFATKQSSERATT